MVVVGSRDIHVIATMKGDGNITIVASVARTDDGLLVNILDSQNPMSLIDGRRVAGLIQTLIDCEYND